MQAFYKKAISSLLVWALLASALPAYGAAETSALLPEEEQTAASSISGTLKTYSDYLAENGTESVPFGAAQTLTTADVVEKSGNARIEQDIGGAGRDGVIIPDSGSATWGFEVPEDCTYVLDVLYMAGSEGSGYLELPLLVDGEIPFRQVSAVSFRRTFGQDPAKEFSVNVAGNDVAPESREVKQWRSQEIGDSSGYVASPFLFFFSAGAHTITFSGSRGEIAIHSLALKPYEAPASYEEYLAAAGGGADGPDTDAIVIQGERFTFKNSVTILPQSDRSSAATFPQSAEVLRLNTVGGENWKTVGDALIWSFEVEEAGFYEISLRFKQSYRDGIYTSRKLLIDGRLPFEEVANLRFHYSSSWQTQTLGEDGTAFRFYLEPGPHTLTLEAVAGDTAAMNASVESALNTLNQVYRRIVMITGKSPDTNRDYHFESALPEEIRQLAAVHDELQATVDAIDAQAGAVGSYTSVIRKILYQLEQMSTQPRTIAKNLEQFKSNLGALSSWLQTANEQPLLLDEMAVYPAGRTEAVHKKDSFWSNAVFAVQCFYYSFLTDYAVIGAPSADGTRRDLLKVWIQTGRDQGNIIRELIDNGFSEPYSANVSLEIVPAGTLLPSVLADQAPDVVLDNAATVPIDYAVRGAVYDLTRFSDYEEVSGWFSPASLRACTFGGSVYGMPQTLDFFMLFYRKDIFEEYGFTVPKTWDELVTMIPTLQRNGMEVSMPATLDMYASLLYQRGGELYREDGARTNLDSSEAINAFIDFSEFYTLYDLPVAYNFANRFRSGEVPMGIENYSLYNQLTAFAPEIKGLWEMVPIPGTFDGQGGIDNTAVGTSTYILLMESSENKDLAWSFMKWFMSADVQSAYSERMESLLGNCAKVNTANMQALSQMTWSSAEYKSLYAQLEHVDAVPQVPGGYYLSRVFSFAFNRVYNSSSTQSMGEEPAEVLKEYIGELNQELARKRREFGVE